MHLIYARAYVDVDFHLLICYGNALHSKRGIWVTDALFFSCVTLKFCSTYLFLWGMNSLVRFACLGYTALVDK